MRPEKPKTRNFGLALFPHLKMNVSIYKDINTYIHRHTVHNICSIHAQIQTQYTHTHNTHTHIHTNIHTDIYTDIHTQSHTHIQGVPDKMCQFQDATIFDKIEQILLEYVITQTHKQTLTQPHRQPHGQTHRQTHIHRHTHRASDRHAKQSTYSQFTNTKIDTNTFNYLNCKNTYTQKHTHYTHTDTHTSSTDTHTHYTHTHTSHVPHSKG